MRNFDECKTTDELKTTLQKARNERQNHEIGTYAYNIWSREVRRLQNLIKNREKAE